MKDVLDAPAGVDGDLVPRLAALLARADRPMLTRGEPEPAD